MNFWMFFVWCFESSALILSQGVRHSNTEVQEIASGDILMTGIHSQLLQTVHSNQTTTK